MAALTARFRGKIDSALDFLKVVACLLVPLACIMLQPDLGTGMVFFAIGITILFTGGARRRWLIIATLATVALVAFALFIDPILDQWMGSDVFLKQYQKDRLLVFLNADLDPTGVGYNIQQAKIAIGSGGLFGKGLTMGTQSGLGFLPEAPTDFIFCVLAEELGFMGSLALILLYCLLIAAAFRIALKAGDLFGTLIVMGIIGMWTFQILENIGMTCGLMPITGIPLPFMSYGSSFMIVNFMALGLILSVWTHRTPKQRRDQPIL
jgi:rod shape determining protein RodA